MCSSMSVSVVTGDEVVVVGGSWTGGLGVPSPRTF